jgi:hypothetical protein
LLSSLVLALLAASAYAVPLQSLIDSNGVIVEGDKLFYNFDVVVTGIGTYAADPSQIEVNGITVGNDYGLRFDTATGAPILSADPDSFVDVLLSFDVAVLDPLYGIAEIDLAFAGFCAGRRTSPKWWRPPGAPWRLWLRRVCRFPVGRPA